MSNKVPRFQTLQGKKSTKKRHHRRATSRGAGPAADANALSKPANQAQSSSLERAARGAPGGRPQTRTARHVIRMVEVPTRKMTPHNPPPPRRRRPGRSYLHKGLALPVGSRRHRVVGRRHGSDRSTVQGGSLCCVETGVDKIIASCQNSTRTRRGRGEAKQTRSAVQRNRHGGQL